MKLKSLFALCMSTSVAAGAFAQNVANYSIDIPSDARLILGIKPNNKHFVDFTNVEPVSVVVNGDISTYSFNLASSQVYNYRVSKDGGLTHAGYFTMNSDETKRPALAFSNDDFTAHNPKHVNHDPQSNNGYETGDIFVNINPQGHLNLVSGQSFELHAMRSWELTNNVVSNYFFEPDFHYAVYDLNGKPSEDVISVSQADGSSWATVTALGKGAAIVVVTYDAINVNYYNGAVKNDFVGGSFWGAVWPENSAVFVVTVDWTESSIQPNMLINEEYNADTQKLAGKFVDAEHDVFYFLDSQDGYHYTFFPANVAKVEIAYPAIGDNSVSFSGFGDEGVTDNGDGSFSLTLKEGRQIVKLSDAGGNSRFQVLTAKKCHREIFNLSRPSDSSFQPGDKVGVQYSGLFHPANKLAGVYNMSAFLTYNGIPNGSVTVGTPSQYQFASNEAAQATSFTIPDDISVNDHASYVIDRGVIQVNGNGDPIGNHRNISKTEGRLPNLNAVSHKTYFGALPPIEIQLQPMEMFNISLNINVDGARVKLVYNGQKEIFPGSDGSYSWTYGDYTLTATKENYRCFRYHFSLSESDDRNQIIDVELQKGPEGVWDGVSVAEVIPDQDGVYHISSAAELAYISQLVNASKNSVISVTLERDIDLGNFDWTPIAKEKTNNFAGKFDGNGHHVFGLYINDSSLSYAGLFGYVKGLSSSQAVIQNVILDADIRASNYVGAVAGYVDNYSSVSRCANYGTVSGESYVGGIVGYLCATKCSLSDCYNVGEIVGNSNVGGIVGYNKAAAVMNNMFNVGNVNGSSAVGACVGGTAAKTNLSNAFSIVEYDIVANHTLVTNEQMASGEVAYRLGDAFFQTIGKDYHPNFDGLKVYFDANSGTYYNIVSVEILSILDKDVMLDLENNPTIVLTAVHGPENAETPVVVWTSSDETIVTVEHEGKLQATATAVKPGIATITVSHIDNPEVYDSCDIVVTTSSSIDIIFKDSNETINVYDISGRSIKLNASSAELTKLPNGLYIITVGQKQHKVLIK